MFQLAQPSEEIEKLNVAYAKLQNLKLAIELRTTTASQEYTQEAKQLSEYITKLLTNLNQGK
jgi:hypothetical protein